MPTPHQALKDPQILRELAELLQAIDDVMKATERLSGVPLSKVEAPAREETLQQKDIECVGHEL